MVILSCAGKKIFAPNATGAYVLRFDCFFSDLRFSQSWGHNQRFWSLSQSREQVTTLERVVVRLIHKHCWALCLLNQMSFWVLMWCWLAYLLWAILEGIRFFSHPGFLIFVIFYETQVAPQSVFGLGTWVWQKTFGKSELAVKFFPVNWFCRGNQPVWLQKWSFIMSVSLLFGECTWRLLDCSEWGPYSPPSANSVSLGNNQACRRETCMPSVAMCLTKCWLGAC